MLETLFANLSPSQYVWVSPNGSDSNSGTESAPLKTIQAAVDRATPGTAVMVKAGTYSESVKINQSGTDGAPIWLVSADGKGAAQIVAQDANGIYGYGQENIVIRGFDIRGGQSNSAADGNGIQFTQAISGDWKAQGGNKAPGFMQDVPRNLVIEDNIIHGSRVDGIKIAQASNVVIRNNVVGDGCDQEGIDFVTVSGALVTGNEIRNVKGNSGLTMKGGTQDVHVEGNTVHNVGNVGIKIGGTSETFKIPDGVDFEARSVTVQGNAVHSTGSQSIAFIGAADSKAIGNTVATMTVRDSTGRNGPDFEARGNEISGNVVDAASAEADGWLSVAPEDAAGLVVASNAMSSGQALPDGVPAALIEGVKEHRLDDYVENLAVAPAGDALSGTAAPDAFVYGALAEGGDSLVNFTPGQDLVDLRPLLSTLPGAGIVVADTADGASVIVDHQGTQHAIVTLSGLSADQVTPGIDVLGG